MQPAMILFGLGCALAVLAAVRSKDIGARIIAGQLTVLWALANAAWLKDMLWVLPVLDLFIGISARTIGWLTGANWVALIVNAVIIRLVSHVLDALTGHLFLVAYIHALNATFVWMLVVVAAGGDHGSISDYISGVLRWLRGVRRSATHAFGSLIRGR